MAKLPVQKREFARWMDILRAAGKDVDRIEVDKVNGKLTVFCKDIGEVGAPDDLKGLL